MTRKPCTPADEQRPILVKQSIKLYPTPFERRPRRSPLSTSLIDLHNVGNAVKLTLNNQSRHLSKFHAIGKIFDHEIIYSLWQSHGV